jgi:protein-S-isoprenylcysteine O-methyltransferase Ste14
MRIRRATTTWIANAGCIVDTEIDPMLWIRAITFVLAVQLTVVGVVPWLLARVSPHIDIGRWHYLGLIPLGVGAAVILWCNWVFVTRGRGTAAPYEPPRVLVAHGLYNHVRNPMYVAAVLIVLGAAAWTGALILPGYALLLALGYDLFVRYYEEPRLARSFGASYAQYCRTVPRWGWRWRRGRGQ